MRLKNKNNNGIAAPRARDSAPAARTHSTYCFLKNYPLPVDKVMRALQSLISDSCYVVTIIPSASSTEALYNELEDNMRLSTEWWNNTITEAIPEERVDYHVHLKYVRRIAALSKDLAATNSLRPVLSAAMLKDLDPKMRLLDRTRESLADEVGSIKDDADYAQACVAWLPAKVYYNLYHLLSIIEYLVSGNKALLRIGHTYCLSGLAARIAEGRVAFSCPLFNIVCDKSILDFKSRPGEVLSNHITDARLLKLIMKKIANDKLADLKIRHNINRQTIKGREAYERERNKLNISIVDFFYSMRIRTNYKDMSFIDDVDAERTRLYFMEYYEAADNFYNCLNDVKNELIGRIRA